jgi:hypothetical protein
MYFAHFFIYFLFTICFSLVIEVRDQIVRGELQEVVFVATFLSTILNFDRKYSDGNVTHRFKFGSIEPRTGVWSGPGFRHVQA